MHSLSLCYGDFCVPSHNTEFTNDGTIEKLQQNEHIEKVSNSSF